jgi:uncharacterized protein
MSPDVESVIRLQSLDDRAAALQKEITALPKHLAETERKLDAHLKRLEADRAALTASQKKKKSLEDDIKTYDAKVSKLKTQMLEAKTNEQYKAFQNEIAYAEKQISDAETEILVQMETYEPLEKAVKVSEAALALEKKAVSQEQEQVRTRTAADQGELKKVLAERAELAKTIDPRVLGMYERSRKRWHNSGVSDATSGRCEACNIALRPQYFQELKIGDRVMTCESCARILIYNPPVALDHELHQKV